MREICTSGSVGGREGNLPVYPTAVAPGTRIAGEDGAFDDYAFTCASHIELVAGPGYVVAHADHVVRGADWDEPTPPT